MDNFEKQGFNLGKKVAENTYHPDDEFSADYENYGHEVGYQVSKEVEKYMKSISEKIGKEHGEDASTLFEVGFLEGFSQLKEAKDYDAPKSRNDGFYEGKTQVDEDKRNNSYFGKNGVSNKYEYDESTGKYYYNDPDEIENKFNRVGRHHGF